MKTLETLIENGKAEVIGAEFTDGTRVTLPSPIPRAELASKARELAAAFGVELPDNPAIPPAK